MFNKFDVIWASDSRRRLDQRASAILSYRHAFSLFDIGGGAAIATISFAILSVAVFFYFRIFPLEDD